MSRLLGGCKRKMLVPLRGEIQLLSAADILEPLPEEEVEERYTRRSKR
jgi:hypothetical protein